MIDNGCTNCDGKSTRSLRVVERVRQTAVFDATQIGSGSTWKAWGSAQPCQRISRDRAIAAVTDVQLHQLAQ